MMFKMKHILTALTLSLLLLPFNGYAQGPGKANPAKKNLVLKEWNTDAKGGNRRLDHITTYNADGKKIEEIEYDSLGQKWRKRYEYTALRCTKEMVYDNRNRLITIKKFEYDAAGRKKTQYNYDAKGHLLTIKNFEYLTSNAE